MKDLVEYLACSLVDDPSSVIVASSETNSKEVIRLTVKGEDLGKVIGKRGKTAQAMRTLLSVFGSKQKKRLFLDIVESSERGEKKELDAKSDERQIAQG